MSSSSIAAHAPAAANVAIEVVEQTGSTNADLLARVGRMPQPSLLAAELQTAGRGRAGRSWISASGSLAFSLAWPFRCALRDLAGMPLAVGVALAETLAANDVAVRLKWPNDLWLDDAKLGGILIETALDRSGAQQGVPQVWAVIGVGINIAQPEELLQQIGRPIAALPANLAQDRSRLMGMLLDGLAVALRQFEQEGFAVFAARWNALHAWTGQNVVILENGHVIQEGIATGVDAQGQLLLQGPDGVVPVLAGDVSLRRQESGNKNKENDDKGSEEHAAAG
ncbi:biotin--[acetyl-CoA-carboxylase] ligase [Paucimonas lemoignei]|uniref:biotin--[acetyl-CoA-carboxylase] ligase n=1 Tax=Paucimonas lemoignei TaxID=29443 RepID=UPI00311D7C3A